MPVYNNIILYVLNCTTKSNRRNEYIGVILFMYKKSTGLIKLLMYSYNIITLVTNPRNVILLLLLDISDMYSRHCGVGNLETVIYQYNIIFTYHKNRE